MKVTFSQAEVDAELCKLASDLTSGRKYNVVTPVPGGYEVSCVPETEQSARLRWWRRRPKTVGTFDPEFIAELERQS